MRILGVDPGTRCGYAVVDGDSIVSGVWDLSARRHEGGGMRFLRLEQHLKEILKTGIHAVAYEEVRSHTRFFGGRPSFATDAAHIYGGCIAIIATACEGRTPPIPYVGIPVGTVKKLATGKGNANKELMLEAANNQWPDAHIVDDNEADARFIALVLARDLGVESAQGQQQSGARTHKARPPAASRPTLPTEDPDL